MYRIIGADGKEYGPITADQVRQWVAEGRANAQTRVLLEGTTEWKTLGELPEFGGAPPSIAPPDAIPGMPSMPVPAAATRASELVSGPAIGLMVVGGLDILFSLSQMAKMLVGGRQMAQGTGNPEMDKIIMSMMGPLGLVFGIVWLLTGVLMLFGGIKMKKLEGYGLAMAASIIAMIPCFSSICCLAGLPIGIWALVVLSKPEVKSSFH